MTWLWFTSITSLASPLHLFLTISFLIDLCPTLPQCQILFINYPEYCFHLCSRLTCHLPSRRDFVFLYTEIWMAIPPPNSEEDFNNVSLWIIMTRVSGMIKKKTESRKKAGQVSGRKGGCFVVQPWRQWGAWPIWWGDGSSDVGRES